MEHRDRLWPGGYTFLYDDGLFRPSTDTFLLGAFPRLRRGMTVCELGAGTGLLSLLLLHRKFNLPKLNHSIEQGNSRIGKKLFQRYLFFLYNLSVQ